MKNLSCIILLFVVVTVFSACKTDVNPNWINFSPSDMGLTADPLGAFLEVDTLGGVYVLSRDYDTDVMEYAYRSPSGSWQRHKLLDESVALNYTTANGKDGTVWLLAEAYLYHVRDGEIIRQYEISDPSFTYQYNAFWGVEVGAGRVWLLNHQTGLHELDVETGNLTLYADTTTAKEYYRIAADDLGNVWISHKDFFTSRLMHFTPTEEWEYYAGDNPVFDCSSCTEGSVSQYVYPRRLEFTDNNQLYMLTVVQGQSSPRVVWRVDSDTIIPVSENVVYYNRIRSDKIGRVWLAGNGLGLIGLLENGEVSTINNSDLYGEPKYVADLQFDTNGNMWISTENGIAVYNENGVEF